MSDTPLVPSPHFPSPYQRPSQPPALARLVGAPDGANIATFVYGDPTSDATPVLFLHGNGEEHGIFGPQIDAVIKNGRTAVAIDSRAQGRSTRGTSRLTYELMAEDAIRVVDDLGISRVHVVGFSDGAILALLLARDHADRVASALSIGANLTPEGVVDDEWDMEGAAQALEEWASWTEAQADIDPTILSPSPVEARRTAELLRLMLEEPHIKAASLEGIACPVTVLVGGYDCILPAESRAIAHAIPDCELVVVPRAGHVLPKHEPDAVTRVMLDTIARA